jgi:hypothetical protein
MIFEQYPIFGTFYPKQMQRSIFEKHISLQHIGLKGAISLS